MPVIVRFYDKKNRRQIGKCRSWIARINPAIRGSDITATVTGTLATVKLFKR